MHVSIVGIRDLQTLARKVPVYPKETFAQWLKLANRDSRSCQRFIESLTQSNLLLCRKFFRKTGSHFSGLALKPGSANQSDRGGADRQHRRGDRRHQPLARHTIARLYRDTEQDRGIVLGKSLSICFGL